VGIARGRAPIADCIPTSRSDREGAVSTQEQRDYRNHPAEITATGQRYRLTADADGFPMIPGRYGQVEYLGDEHDTGERRLRVYTSRPRLIARLRALPGLHTQQVGDADARFWFRAGAPETLTVVCCVIRARIRRPAVAPVSAGFRRTG
jgi:hypothetical protein